MQHILKNIRSVTKDCHKHTAFIPPPFEKEMSEKSGEKKLCNQPGARGNKLGHNVILNLNVQHEELVQDIEKN